MALLGGLNPFPNVATLGVGVESRGAVQSLTSFSTAAHNAGKATEKFERTTKNLTVSLGGLAGVFGIRQLIEYADSWTLISARIGVVTESTEEVMAVQQKLFEIAQRSRNTLNATAVLYTRVALNADELGRSHNDLLTMVEAVNNALLISGATGVEAAQSMRQLAQALGSGRLQGDEFRTVMEAMPVVARAIADEMGVATGELKDLAKEGLIDVQTMIDALLNRAEALSEEVDNMQWTVAQAVQIFQNSMIRLIGVMNAGTGATLGLGNAIRWAGDNLNEIVSVISGVVAALVSYKIAVLGASIAQAAFTSAQALYKWYQLTKAIEGAARTMALLSALTKGLAGVLALAGTAAIGFAAYKTVLAAINAEMTKWENAQGDLNALLGEAKDKSEIDENIAKTRNEIEDMIREAHQAVVLATLQNEELERQEIAYDAINKRVEARRELEGTLLEEMLAAIDLEEELMLQVLETEAAIEAVADAIEERTQIIERFATNLQRSFARTFQDILEDGISSFGDLFDAIKVMFFNLLAEIAAAKMMDRFRGPLEDLIDGIVGTTTDEMERLEEIAHAMRVKAAASVDPAELGGRKSTAPPEPVQMSLEYKKQAGRDWGEIFTKGLGAALAGLTIGSAFGATGSSGLGFLGGAAGGAMAGFQIGGPMGAAIGGVVGAVSGLMGASQAQKEEMRRHRAVLEQNNQRLQQLRDVIHGTTIGGRLLDARQAMAEIERIRRTDNTVFGSLIRMKPHIAVLRTMAEELGIDLSAPGAMEQLAEAIDLSVRALTEFGKTLDELTRKQDAYNRLFDVEMNPQQQLQDTFDIMMQMAPDLMRELGLANLDLTTQAGRDLLIQGLREIYNMIVSGELTPELLGGFTDKNQLLDAILRTKDALDEFHSQLVDVTTDFPRAMDIIFYEQLFGRFTTGQAGVEIPTGGESGGGGTIQPPPGGRGGGGGELGGGGVFHNWTVHGVTIISEGDETGEELLEKIESAAQERVNRGGRVIIPTTAEESF